MGKRENGILDVAQLHWRQHDGLHSLWADAAPRPVMQGRFVERELRPGLSLHGNSVVFAQGISGTGVLAPGLKLIVMLEGEACACFGRTRIRLGGEAGACVLLAAPAAEEFQRVVPRACRQRQIVLTIAPEWLAQSGLARLPEVAGLEALQGQSLACRRWPVAPPVRQLAECLLAAGQQQASPWRQLQLESRALDLLQAALMPLADAEAPPLDPRGRQRVQQLLEWLHSGEAAGWSLAQMARALGTNPTTLQRQFRSQTGRSIVDYLRHYRLAEARRQLQQGLPVTTVALEAGYSSPANFATACKREFGLTPRELARLG